MNIISGKVIILGDNINTDFLHHPEFFSLNPERLLKGFLMSFKKMIPEGNLILLGGENFGCGSSRESTIYALKLAGVKVIIAKSFARIFYRNCWNLTLPALETKYKFLNIVDEEKIEIDINEFLVHFRKKTIHLEKPPQYFRLLYSAGGLIPFLMQSTLIGKENENIKTL